MTDARLAALEAVAEAADHLLNNCDPDMVQNRRGALRNRLNALRALPAQPQPAGETVEVAVWQDEDGAISLMRAGWMDDGRSQEAKITGHLPNATRLGTVTLRLDAEVTP